MHQRTVNGTIIADLCYKDGEAFRTIGSLIYFRTHEAEIRLDIIPAKAWATEVEWFIGNFIESEKVPEPPFVDGDITAVGEVRGKRVKLGHIHTRDNEVGQTQYFFTLFGVPTVAWSKIIEVNLEGGGKHALYLKVEMEENQ